MNESEVREYPARAKRKEARPPSHSTASSDDSSSLNELDGLSRADIQGISLLKQIFPDDSTEELRLLHQQRVMRGTPQQQHRREPPDSRLGNRIRQKLTGSLRRRSSLTHDFLRLPPDFAVRRYCERDRLWNYELVGELEARALDQYFILQGEPPDAQWNEFYTEVLFRDSQVGLGMTLFEERGLVRVHSLNGRIRATEDSYQGTSQTSPGPAYKAGIEPGDILVGINGIALERSLAPVDGAIQHAVSSLVASPDPVVLHFRRLRSADDQVPGLSQIDTKRTVSLLDTSDFLEESPSVELSFQVERSFRSTPTLLERPGHGVVHPFSRALSSKNLIDSRDSEFLTSRMISEYTERARQWEAQGSFTISTQRVDESIFVPLMGVRKALSFRIVNSFLDVETAYTIWVHDLESSREWYAPVRYFRDFQDLRAATQWLHPSICQLPFPKAILSIFGSPVRSATLNERVTRCHQLESFLRHLNGMIFREPLHPSMAEISLHVQSFLGCDAVVGSSGMLGLATDEISDGTNAGHEARIRLALKRSIQQYTYRLFLLPPLSAVVDSFVSAIRTRAPRLQDIEVLEAEGRSALKARALDDLKRIQLFLDLLQEVILVGCYDDFRSIALREDYEALHCKVVESDPGDDYWERLVREAVREQVEIEVYVPLRGVVSRWLVNGWKREDMEVQFKIRELCKRPDEFFGLSISDFRRLEPVATILKGGVGQSTLPCVKLRAIVDAASEISRIFSRKQDGNSGQNGGKSAIYMGADEFLPIFIYCVVKADMERPCALCILIRTLRDPIHRIGEAGYYLASFEAAITHLQEIDLSEHRDEKQSSFMSIPLDN
jgi:hypothetical protein